MTAPSPPSRAVLPSRWPHADLHDRVRDALTALPSYFKPETRISGVSAVDLHTLNTMLGATIENQTVATLNAMRPVWDPLGNYRLYSFVRQPQTFPDILFRRSVSVTGPGDEIILGIELKGWYVLAKEEVPTFRFSVTPAVCAEADLLVVVPWALSEVLSGSPIMFEPYIEEARYAALFRNHWWEHVRVAGGNVTIVLGGHAAPYPSKKDHIDDKPASDSGGNFGRLARTGLMDAYMKTMKDVLLCGVRVDHWLAFLKAVQAEGDDTAIRKKLAKLAKDIAKHADRPDVEEAADALIDALRRIVTPGAPDSD